MGCGNLIEEYIEAHSDMNHRCDTSVVFSVLQRKTGRTEAFMQLVTPVLATKMNDMVRLVSFFCSETEMKIAAPRRGETEAPFAVFMRNCPKGSAEKGKKRKECFLPVFR